VQYSLTTTSEADCDGVVLLRREAPRASSSWGCAQQPGRGLDCRGNSEGHPSIVGADWAEWPRVIVTAWLTDRVLLISYEIHSQARPPHWTAAHHQIRPARQAILQFFAAARGDIFEVGGGGRGGQHRKFTTDPERSRRGCTEGADRAEWFGIEILVSRNNTIAPHQPGKTSHDAPLVCSRWPLAGSS
jgi:hypothetical protein